MEQAAQLVSSFEFVNKAAWKSIIAKFCEIKAKETIWIQKVDQKIYETLVHQREDILQSIKACGPKKEAERTVEKWKPEDKLSRNWPCI